MVDSRELRDLDCGHPLARARQFLEAVGIRWFDLSGEDWLQDQQGVSDVRYDFRGIAGYKAQECRRIGLASHVSWQRLPALASEHGFVNALLQIDLALLFVLRHRGPAQDALLLRQDHLIAWDAGG